MWTGLASFWITLTYEKKWPIQPSTFNQAEQRATEAERQVSKLQSEVDRVEGTVLGFCVFCLLMLWLRDSLQNFVDWLGLNLWSESRSQLSDWEVLLVLARSFVDFRLQKKINNFQNHH